MTHNVLSEYGANEGDGALLSAPLTSVGVVDWKGSVTPELVGNGAPQSSTQGRQPTCFGEVTCL